MTPLSSLLMGKHHTGLHLAPETELALLSDQAVHLVEGLELDKLNEKFLPIKDTHQNLLGWLVGNHSNVSKCTLNWKIGVIKSLKRKYSAPFRKVVVDDGKSDRIIVNDNRELVSTQHAITEYQMNRDYTVLFPLVSQGVLVSSQSQGLIDSPPSHETEYCRSSWQYDKKGICLWKLQKGSNLNLLVRHLRCVACVESGVSYLSSKFGSITEAPDGLRLATVSSGETLAVRSWKT
ncbi:hypothetical protein Bca52824_086303 [Brassica carinata]|uniref:Uncharacterized protein n=1 Tax=Brassica carinata TaxID=52824 RepID=A0A8X7TLQ8_BRACI|nr:hypothetical protein Bca52824_086303 [Brassica carinata]